MKISNLRRILIEEHLNTTNFINLDKEHVHYIINVLRFRAGDRIRVFNSNNGEFLAKLYKYDKNDFKLELLEKLREPLQPSKINLALGLVKMNKFTLAIEKATELGVDTITPLLCNHSQLKTINYDRLNRCIKEATEQSEQFRTPILHDATTMSNFAKDNQHQLVLVCNENESCDKNLLSYQDMLKNNSSEITLIIGPEGGFDKEELQLIEHYQNFHSVSLGKTVLTTETAVISSLAQINLIKKL